MRESVKHRLIGAAVLAAITVLFLPSFFKDRQQYQVDTSSHIPGRPSITAVDFNEPTRPEGIEPAPAPETMFVPDEAEAIPPEQVPPAEQAGVAVVASSSAQSTSSKTAVA
ncbi:MAG: SPOR domain-containing protein, partial [Cellvibrio sp.]